MTDDEIRKAFSEMSIRDNKTPQGADYAAILRDLAAQSGKPLEHVTNVIVTDTIGGNV